MMKSISALAFMFAMLFATMPSSAAQGNANEIVNPTEIVALFNCKTGEKVWEKSEAEPKPPVKMAAYGFCELRGGNGNYSCGQGTCTGTCKLNNYPASCSCK